MAFENLFIRTKRSIGGVELDATLRETHSTTVTATSNPVELGADITDNAAVEPVQLELQVAVSDTPLGLAAFTGLVDTVTGLFGSSTTNNLTRSQAAYNTMVEIQNQREPISVQTKLKLYENMLITNISVSQDKDTSRIVMMNISLKEMIIVETETVKLDQDQLKGNTTKQQASSAEKSGRKEAVTPGAGVKKSWLKSIGEFLQ